MNLDLWLKPLKKAKDEVLEWLRREYSHIRTGRVNPDLLGDLTVQAYGSRASLKNVSSINIIGPRTLQVVVWDSGIAKDVERAISEANLGASLREEKENTLSVIFPELSSEMREKLFRHVHQKTEQARIKLRQHRDKTWKKIQDDQRSGELSEDSKFKLKDQLQKIVDGANEEFQRLEEQKRKELGV